MGFSLLARAWPYLLLSIGLIGGTWYAHRSGYESGRADEKAVWQPRFEAAAREFAAANERERRKEASSISLSQQAEADHEKVVASLNLRADAAERRYAVLLRQRTASTSCGAVREASGATRDPDAARAIDQRYERAAKDFGRLARACEADAAALSDLQQWVRGQLAIQRE